MKFRFTMRGYATAGDEIEAKAYLEEIITENDDFNVVDKFDVDVEEMYE